MTVPSPATPALTPTENRVNVPVPRPLACLLVAVGGSAGTSVRALVSAALPGGVVSFPTLAVNVTGAFLIAVLYRGLALRADRGEASWGGWRLLLGTGFLGGYTTYSALALSVARVGPVVGLVYALVSVGSGVAACLGGVAVADALAGRRRP